MAAVWTPVFLACSCATPYRHGNWGGASAEPADTGESTTAASDTGLDDTAESSADDTWNFDAARLTLHNRSGDNIIGYSFDQEGGLFIRVTGVGIPDGDTQTLVVLTAQMTFAFGSERDGCASFGPMEVTEGETFEITIMEFPQRWDADRWRCAE
jgi:hypothetical protein